MLYEDEIINIIEQVIEDTKCLQVQTVDNNLIHIFSHRLLYLEGYLSLVGENCSDRCLIYLALNEIKDIKINATSKYLPNYSTIEVNDFLSAIRAVGGHEERLVLKIYANEEVDINPEYHFFGKPYATSNSSGDSIWGASIEVSDYIYEWLLSLKGKVEILDPESVKRGLLSYCERKLKRDEEFKKAS